MSDNGRLEMQGHEEADEDDDDPAFDSDDDDEFGAQDLLGSIILDHPDSEQVKALKTFCKKARLFLDKKQGSDIVQDFLNIPDSCLKLANLISDGKSSSPRVTAVFKALHCILLRINGDLKHFDKVGNDAIHCVLQTGLGPFLTLLAHQKYRPGVKASLQLLTLMVLMGSHFAKTLASQFTAFSSKLCSLANMRRFEDPVDIRTCVIHFIMSFLISDIHYIISQICEQRDILNLIIYGLPYDKASCIQPFLTTFKSKFLENAKISKTQKIKIFNERTLSSIYSLLSWKGPKTLADKKLFKKAKQDDAWILQDASEDEVETVQMTAFEFLQVACSSHKHGIIFHTNQTRQGRNPNHTITRMLLSDQCPFEDWRKRQLAAQILCACPDQSYYFLSEVKATFEPRNSMIWHQAMMFITKAASLQDLEAFFSQCGPQRDVLPLVRKIQTSLGMLVLNKKIIFSALRSKDWFLKLVMTDWLIVTLGKIHNIPSLQSHYPGWNVQTICNELLNYLPSLSDVLPIFLDAEQLDVEVSNTNLPEGVELTVVDYLNKMTDLLVLCSDLSPTSLESTHPGAFPKLLSLIKSHQDKMDKPSLMLLQLKVLKLIGPDLTTTHLWSDKVEGKHSAFYMLFDICVNGREKSTSDSAKQLVFQLFSTYDVFGGYDWELEIWLQELQNLPKKTRSVALKLFCHAVQSFFQNPNQFSDIVMDSRLDAMGKGVPDETLNLNMSNEELITFLEKKYVLHSGKVDRTQRCFFTPLVPAVAAVLSEHATETDFSGYFEIVIWKILHRQQEPEALCLLLNSNKDILSKFMRNYIGFWHPDGFSSRQGLHASRKFWKKHLSKLDLPKVQESSGHRLLSAFVLLSQTSIVSEKEHLLSVTEAIKTASPSSYAEAEDLFYQTLFYLQAQLQLISVGEDACSMLILCSYLDEIVSYQLSSLSDDSVKADIVWKLLSHPIFKDWFLTSNEWQQSACLNKNAQKCSYFLTDFTCKYLNIVAKLNCDTGKLTDIFSPFLSKLMSLADIVFSNDSKDIETVWLNISQSIASCIDMLSLSQVAQLLNKLLAMSTSRLLQFTDTTDVIQILLRKYIEYDAKSEYWRIQTGTVKALLEFVCLVPEDQNKDIEDVKFCISAFLEQNSVFCVVVNLGCFDYFLSNGGPANLSLVKIICKHSLSHCSHLCKWLKLHLSTLILWPPLHCIQIIEIAFAFHLSELEDNSFPLSELSNMYWQHLGSLIIPGGKYEDAFEEGLGVTPLLQALLQKDKIQKSSLEVITEQAVEENLNCRNVPNVNTLTLLSQMFKTIQSSCPSFVISGKTPRTNLIKIHLHSVQTLLGSAESTDLLLLDFASEALSIIQAAEKNEILDALKDLNFWFQFVTSLLRKGLRCHITGPILINLLKELCQVAYIDSQNVISPTPVELLRLVLEHSAFSSFMIEEESHLQVLKEPVVDLWTELATLDSSCCLSDHFPVLLSSFRATLAPTDQKLFYLMSYYEEMGVSMHGFRPFMWGPSALSFYMSQAQSRLSLWKQPKLEDILHLLDKEKILTTSLKFPLDVQLKLTRNFLSGKSSYEKDDYFHSIFDARFLLLVFNHLVQPGSVVNCEKFISSHCLTFVLSTLSYQDSDLRALGYQVLNLFYQHLEGRRNYQNKTWIFILNVLRNSLKGPNICLPSMITSFLVKALSVLSKQNDPSYNIIYKFLILKPELDTENIPEFYELFYSSDVQHMYHRTWILSLLQDGLRTSKDFHLFQKRFVFPILLSYCTSAICTVQHKVMILRILRSAVGIWSAAFALCRAQSLMTWIQSLIVNHIPEKYMEEMFPEVVLILETLCETSGSSNPKHAHLRKKPGKRRKEIENDLSDEEHSGSDLEQDSSVDRKADGALRESSMTEVNEEAMDVDTEYKMATRNLSPFYPSFPKELLLVCLSLLNSLSDQQDIATLCRCLKICHTNFISCSNTKAFLPYLTEEHLDFLISCAHPSSKLRPNGSSFSARTSFSLYNSCRESATRIIMLVSPRIYINSPRANSVFESVNSLLSSEHVDFEFVESVCLWLNSCLKDTPECEHFVSYLWKQESGGSQCVALLLVWISKCIADVGNCTSLACLKSEVVLFLRLITEKQKELADACNKMVEAFDGVIVGMNSAKMILELASLIVKIWLENFTCKKSIRKLQKFNVSIIK